MNLPKDFENYTRRLFGDTRYQLFLQSLEQEAPVSIRLNPFKLGANERVSASYDPQQIPWCKEGFYLDKRPNFTFDPMFHAGTYYVQEASSMFLAHVLRHLVKHPVTMLDLCAAPGGKSTCARAVIPEGSVLFSNEPLGKRAQILAENIQKFGHPDVVVTNNYPRDYKKTKLTFDVILADVPCSGEGMFRKDPKAVEEWNLGNVENCARLQREIIADIWDNLTPGGILVFSTCTFNAHENEENIAWILNEYDARLIDIPVESDWEVTGSLLDPQATGTHDFPIYRFIPGISKGEGLFMAVIRKKGECERKDHRWAISAEDLIPYAKKKLKVLSCGTKDGVEKGNMIIPDHSSALSIATDKNMFPVVDVDYTTAVSYLRREAIVLPQDVVRGIVTLTYKGHTIGFAKNLGNRANNLYPHEWRIKSGHIPDEPNIIDISL
nr:hypothetical protein [uncultured Prevotella sp.]